MPEIKAIVIVPVNDLPESAKDTINPVVLESTKPFEALTETPPALVYPRFRTVLDVPNLTNKLSLPLAEMASNTNVILLTHDGIVVVTDTVVPVVTGTAVPKVNPLLGALCHTFVVAVPSPSPVPALAAVNTLPTVYVTPVVPAIVFQLALVVVPKFKIVYCVPTT